MYQRMFHKNDDFVHSGIYYIDFMALLNKQLHPRSYFEIGTDNGNSLNCFTCDSVCVDPDFQIKGRVWQGRRKTFLYQCNSDDFFAEEDLRNIFPKGPDIAFLDGMHRAEYLLRDFMNTERMAHRRSLILMHDCLPLNARMAGRVPCQGAEEEGVYRDAWTGDVWRVLFALKRKRPDLIIRYLDCPPTGLVAISNLDPGSNILHDEYSHAQEIMMETSLNEQSLKDLWEMYPIVDTAALTANPADISFVLNCH